MTNKTKNRSFTSTHDMITAALEFMAAESNPYLYDRVYNSAVWHFVRTTHTINDIRSRRTMTPKQVDLVESLEANVNDLSAFLGWSYDKVMSSNFEPSDYRDVIANFLEHQSPEELHASAAKRYEMLPEDQALQYIERFVEARQARQDADMASLASAVAVAQKQGPDTPWELNPYTARSILNGLLRYAEDNSDPSKIEERATDYGLPDDVVEEQISFIPVMEYAVNQLNDMIDILDEHIDQAGAEPFNGMH